MLIPFDYLFKKYNVKAKGVLHVGASVGQEIQAYYDCGIERSVWIEAIPDVFEKLQQQCLFFPNAKALEACIGEKNGETVIFNIANNEGQSSSYLEFGTHSKEHPTVKFIDKIEMQTVRLDSLLRWAEIDLKDYTFLNIDLQGAELFALKSLGKELSKIEYAYIEINERELYRNCPLVKDIDNYMSGFGFKRVETKMTNFGWGDCFMIKK